MMAAAELGCDFASPGSSWQLAFDSASLSYGSRISDGPSLLMGSVQELARNVSHMATRKCSRCKQDKIFADYNGWQWQRRYRVCNGCKEREKQQTIAASGEPSSSPSGQHGGAEVPSAVSGPSTPFPSTPVVWLDACMYICIHACLCHAGDGILRWRTTVSFCVSANPEPLLVVFEIMIN